jgi:hypothetical protein
MGLADIASPKTAGREAPGTASLRAYRLRRNRRLMPPLIWGGPIGLMYLRADDPPRS